MIDFKNIKELRIAGKELYKLVINGFTVWKKPARVITVTDDFVITGPRFGTNTLEMQSSIFTDIKKYLPDSKKKNGYVVVNQGLGGPTQETYVTWNSDFVMYNAGDTYSYDFGVLVNRYLSGAAGRILDENKSPVAITETRVDLVNNGENAIIWYHCTFKGKTGRHSIIFNYYNKNDNTNNNKYAAILLLPKPKSTTVTVEWTL